MKFYSQAGQDQFLFEHFFRGKRNGVFVEVGAFDGEQFSNTLFFERVMGWKGLCIEPSAAACARMSLVRNAACEQAAVGDFEGEGDFVEVEGTAEEKMRSGLAGAAGMGTVGGIGGVKKVAVKRLGTLLEKHGLFEVDYCSIDVGGGKGEWKVLAGLDLERFRVAVFSIENQGEDSRIAEVMAAKGYVLAGKVGGDAVYRRRDVKRLPQTSVICAVWHGDAKRQELLRGHAENLARQSVPVTPVYVFDGGDVAPGWLGESGVAMVASVQGGLTIYQAWNVALSLVETPLVMNLNLDDRLAPDAVALLEKVMEDKNAVAVGGDWHVRYSQEETDKVVGAYRSDRLPFIATWPPVAGSVTRLGSGTGQRGTLGPATMWRMEAHRGAPKYPWRFEDGSLIRTVADLAWWRVMGSRGAEGGKEVQLPMVIGNYHSHPAEQAEFRSPAEEEMRLLREVGVSLL